jgi:UBX domain-containing protein 1
MVRRAPLSLLDVQPGQAVDVRVAKRLDEDYTPPPKAPPKPFEGAGHRLGSPSPEVMSRTSSSASQPKAPKSTHLEVDTTQPVTSLQIRMADGTKLVAKFNHTHTIADVRNFINAYVSTSFIHMAVLDILIYNCYFAAHDLVNPVDHISCEVASHLSL